MKKLLVLAGCLLIATIAYADDIDLGEAVSKAPPINTYLAYDIAERQFKPLETITVGKKDKFSFEIGLTTEDNSVRLRDFKTFVAQVSYDLLEFDEVPYAKDIPVINILGITSGIWAGYNRLGLEDSGKGNFEYAYGISIKLASFKF